MEPDNPVAPAKPPATDWRIRWVPQRREWLASEWPAVVVWLGWSSLLLLGLLALVIHSVWFLLLLPIWWFLAGRRAHGIASFLVTARDRNELIVGADGRIFLSTNDLEPLFAHWVGFVNQGNTFLLWGADGRYRLVIPKRVLAVADYAAIAQRTGLELLNMSPGEELPACTAYLNEGRRRPSRMGGFGARMWPPFG